NDWSHIYLNFAVLLALKHIFLGKMASFALGYAVLKKYCSMGLNRKNLLRFIQSKLHFCPMFFAPS
nr:hypothetical protein [Acinetobacter sp.]